MSSFFTRNNPKPASGGGSSPGQRSQSPAMNAGSYERVPSNNASAADLFAAPRRVPPPVEATDPYTQSRPPPTYGQNQPSYPAYNQNAPSSARGGYSDSSYGGQARGEKAVYQPQGGGGGMAGRGPTIFGVAPCPSDALALSNKLVVHPHDFPPDVEYVLLRGRYVMGIVRDPTRTLPARHIGPAKHTRQWIGLSMQGESVEIEAYEPKNGDWAGTIDLDVGFNTKRGETQETFDTEQLSQMFTSAFTNLPLTPLQTVLFDFRGHLLKATVRSVSTLEGADGDAMGIVMEGTEMRWFKDAASNIKLKNTSNRAPTTAIIAPNFKFEDMGIGGLDTEFAAIFRRAFASRVFPPGLVEKLGIQHVKGILLYGPPGTGKTLMARQIGKMLNAREPKVVNGPEILNKFVGQSEENIRKLFADAEKEQKEKGDESGLHIIIFDEIDAICKQRGSDRGGTGVGDSVVNQLLSKMDGVDQLNNVLVIGMTNRLDMIDEALLRPGRFEVHIEISLPDEAGRVQILTIHTGKMRQNGVMGADVDIAELAALTKNFSGAELGGLVKSATSFAFNRHVKVGTLAGVSDDINNMQITRDDFMHALDEVHAAFGVSEEELQTVVQNGIVHFNQDIETILRDGNLLVEQVRNSKRTPLVSALLHGPPGSGKTALAATMAIASEFPFIKLISPETMVGYTEGQKIAQINKVFMDSYKSPFSVIVIDSIERLLDWIPIGPRFSNGVLQALMVLLGKRPPKDRRLLIFATTSNRNMLDDMEMADSFDTEIRVPAITDIKSLEIVLREVKLFDSDQEYHHTLDLLRQSGFEGEGKLNIGVKKLLSMAEMARQDPDPAEKLTGSLIQNSV